MVTRMILQGRLTADPELRHTQNGTAVASFRVAWSRKYKQETENKLFLPCVAWRGTGEMVARYFVKGQEIAVEGQLNTRSYTDRDGKDRQTTELIVDQVHFCGPKRGGSEGTYTAPEFNDIQDDGELPF